MESNGITLKYEITEYDSNEVIDTIKVKLENDVKLEQIDSLPPLEPFFNECSSFKVKEENNENETQEYKEVKVHSSGEFNITLKCEEVDNEDAFIEVHREFKAEYVDENFKNEEEFSDTDHKIDISDITLQLNGYNDLKFSFESITGSENQRFFSSEETHSYHQLKQEEETISDLKHSLTNEILICKMCSYIAYSKMLLNMHISSTHNPKVIIQRTIKNCQFCAKLFTSKLSLDKHVLNFHITSMNKKGKSKKTCQFCKKMFVKKICLDDHLLKQHQHTKITSLIYKCNICPYQTTSKSSLQRHVNLLHDEQRPKYHCKICNKSVLLKSSFDHHMMNKHKDELKEDLASLITSKIYKCKDCSYQTTHKSDLNTHFSSYHNKQIGKMNCHLCETSFMFKSSLDDHLLKQHKREIEGDDKLITSAIYKCNVCSYQTTTKSCLRRHLNSVHNEQRTKFNCQICEQSFLVKTSLDHHMLNKHKEEIKGELASLITSKIYTCKDCSYQTTHKSDFNYHFNSFHNEQRVKMNCHICNKTFLIKSSLDHHLLNQHPEEIKNDLSLITSKIHKCTLCSYQATAKASLKSHFNAKHTKQRPKIKCPRCDESFASKPALDDHLLQQHQYKKLTRKIHNCDMCSFQTTRKSAFTCHINSFHKEHRTIFNCQICDKSFFFKSSLDHHLLKEHQQEIKGDLEKLITSRIHKCNVCSYQTTKRNSLKRHLNTLHNEQRAKFNCQVCEQSFLMKSSLDRHVLTQHKQEIKDDLESVITSKPYQTTHKSDLNSHFNSYHCNQRAKVLCCICDKSFMNKSSLDRHLLTRHKQEIEGDLANLITSRIYKCNDCSYQTTRKSALNSHVNSFHNKERVKINCHFCDKTFLLKVSLDHHLMHQHQEEIKNDLKSFITSKIYKCKICSYQTTSSLGSHYKSKHNKQTSSLKCQRCGKSFSSKRVLDDHRLKKHKEKVKSKVYKCNMCSYQTTFKSNFVKHFNLRHTKQRSKFNCCLCDQSFLLKTSLDHHLLSQHKQEIKGDLASLVTSKIYKCESCSYQTTHKSDIKSHFNSIHNEQRAKINCHICDKTFVLKSSLDHHLLNKHKKEIKNDLETLITSRIYKCPVCSFQATAKSSITNHFNTRHDKQRPKIKCHLCDKSLFKSSLERHLRKQHNQEIKSD